MIQLNILLIFSPIPPTFILTEQEPLFLIFISHADPEQYLLCAPRDLFIINYQELGDMIEDQLSSHFPTVNWMGQEWYIKTTGGNYVGPGPNVFDSSSAQVDHKGVLNLSIKNNGAQWICAEVMSKNLFHFGNYEFIVQGDVYNIDPNVVFSMFLYPPSQEVGPVGANEIDIQFSRWGNIRAQNLHYTVFPQAAWGQTQTPASRSIVFNYQNSLFSSHQVVWSPNSVQIQSSHLYPNNPPRTISSFAMPVQPSKVPKIPLRCHISLWLLKGNSPTNGQNVNIALRGFKYTPML